jgi:hypothetical protein
MTVLNRPVLTCRRCRKRKRRAEFWPNPRLSTGVSSWCKDCSRASSRASRQRYRDRYNAARRQYPTKHTCTVCGNEFESTNPLATFCPPTDDDRARAKNTQARSWCAKAYDNAQQRGTLDQLLIRVRERGPGRQVFDCAHCGRHCAPGKDGIDPRATRFCCRQHKAAFHREIGREEVAT